MSRLGEGFAWALQHAEAPRDLPSCPCRAVNYNPPLQDQRRRVREPAQPAPHTEGVMYVVVPICFFCERVQDNTGTASGEGPWMALKTYQCRYGLLPEEIWGAHTDCPDCASQYAQCMAHRAFMHTLPLSA